MLTTVFFCVTSLVSVTGFYTENEPLSSLPANTAHFLVACVERETKAQIPNALFALQAFSPESLRHSHFAVM